MILISVQMRLLYFPSQFWFVFKAMFHFASTVFILAALKAILNAAY